MTRNLRIQLADLAEAWLRAARPDLSRERATDLISDWPLAEPWDEETTALVLSRFPAELVPVAGVDFLPQAHDLAEIEHTVGGAGHRWHCTCGGQGPWVSPEVFAQRGHETHVKLHGALVEVTAQPTAEAVDRG